MTDRDELPPPAKPVALYVPAVVSDRLVFVSGHGPLDAGGSPAWTGRIGDGLGTAEAFDATRLTVRNVVATLASTLGGADRLGEVSAVAAIRIFAMGAPGSQGHDDLIAAASRTFAELLPGSALGPVTTIGIASAVFDLPITIDAIFSLDD